MAAKIKLELVFDTFLTLAGIAIIITSVGFGFGTAKEPGPGFFPCFVGVLMVIFGLVLLLTGRKDEAKTLFEDLDGMKRFWLTAAIYAVWLLLLDYLGFLVITFFVTLASSKIMRLEGWLKPVLLALGTTFFIYLVFDIWFYTDLPRGILG